MQEITILRPQISESEYKDSVISILDTLVNNSASPFNEAIDKFEAYLDNATDLDDTQKQSALAGMLKDTYASLSKLAMQYAMEIHKTNSQLELDTYKVEADYNRAASDIAYRDAQTALVSSQKIESDKAIDMSEEKISESRLAQAKLKAEIERQWGYTVTPGAIERTEVTNPDGSVTTTTSYGTTTITESGKDNVIAKQIRGYDLVTYKDVLKTLDEKAALMQNAKVPESFEDKELRAELIHNILLGTDPTGTVKFRDNGSTYATDGILGNATAV
jgi:hypothetical protein